MGDDDTTCSSEALSAILLACFGAATALAHGILLIIRAVQKLRETEYAHRERQQQLELQSRAVTPRDAQTLDLPPHTTVPPSLVLEHIATESAETDVEFTSEPTSTDTAIMPPF